MKFKPCDLEQINFLEQIKPFKLFDQAAEFSLGGALVQVKNSKDVPLLFQYFRQFKVKITRLFQAR